MSFFSPAVIIFIGALLLAAGGLWAAINQNQFESQLKAKQEALEAKNEEIIKLNQQIAKLSIHTMNMVTGGDSYAYIEFGVTENRTAENMRFSKAFISHEGMYPLYDLTIQIHDVTAGKNILITLPRNIGSTGHIKIWPLNHEINIDLSGKTSQRFNIFFYARNGTWTQQMIYEKLETKWVSAIRVFRSNADEGIDILYKYINSEFPIPEQDITWQ